MMLGVKCLEKEQFILDFIEKPEKFYLDDDEKFSINRKVKIELKDIVFFRIDRITYEEKAPQKEALENVLSAMRIDGVNFIYMIKGDKNGVSFYYGISRDLIHKKMVPMEMDELGDLILKPNLESNFRGSKIVKLNELEEQCVLEDLKNMQDVICVDGVPGINDDDENYQGVDRMVDVMLGDEFAFLVVAKALPMDAIRYFEKGIYNFYDELAPISKKSIQQGENESTTNVDTNAESWSESDAHNDQNGKTTNHGKQKTETRSVQKTENRTEGVNVSDNEGIFSVNEGKSDTHTEGRSGTHTTGDNTTNGSSKTTTYESVSYTHLTLPTNSRG